MAPAPQPRDRAIQRLTAILLRRGESRFQMVLLLAATGLAGFLCSALLHAAGFNSMALRYPLAAGVAYLVFLLLLALVVSYHRSRRQRYPADPSGYYGPEVWDLNPGLPPSPPAAATASARATSGNGAAGGGWDLGGVDGDGLAVVVVVLILLAIGAAVFASALVLIEAPVLLAELLVDGVLLAGLARRVQYPNGPHWASGVIRRTVVPLLVVAFCSAAVGYALECLVPGASTMGEALHLARSR